MGTVGAQGFPTFVLQIDGEWVGVPHQRFASAPTQFQDWLNDQLQKHSSTH
jgi:protein-disulfide isomerase-like protein with CxxC motif